MSNIYTLKKTVCFQRKLSSKDAMPVILNVFRMFEVLSKWRAASVPDHVILKSNIGGQKTTTISLIGMTSLYLSWPSNVLLHNTRSILDRLLIIVDHVPGFIVQRSSRTSYSTCTFPYYLQEVLDNLTGSLTLSCLKIIIGFFIMPTFNCRSECREDRSPSNVLAAFISFHPIRMSEYTFGYLRLGLCC